jgi:hypothetical protein
MAVVNYGSIVKGGLQSFNEVDQYLKAEEEKEYQIAKERRDHLYKSDRDKMADFWKHYQQNYQEYRDNVQDDYNERKFEETIRVNDHNIDMANKKHALNVAQHEETKKQNEINALIAVHNAALKQDQIMTENVYRGLNSKTGSTLGGSSKGWSKATPDNIKLVEAIIANSDSPEQKRIAVQELANSITDEVQKDAVVRYFNYKTGLNSETTLQGMRNIAKAYDTVGKETLKDGKTATQEEIAQNFVDYVNTNNQLDLQHAIGSSIEEMMVGTVAKDIVNGKEVILGEIGGYDPNSLRLYHIPNTATVGVVGTFYVNGKPENMIVTNLNGEPIAYDENLIKNISTHLAESQVRSVVQNRNKNKPLTEQQFINTYKNDPNQGDYKTYLEKHKLEQAMPVKRYNKDLDVVTLKDDKAQAYEIDKAVEQSQNKPDTSVVSNMYTDRFNGVEKGDKVYIDDGKVVVPIEDEEQQEKAYLEFKSKEFFSKQLNEKDVAQVQQSKNLSKEKAIKYLHDEYLNKELNKFYRNNPESVEKRVKVDVISKGFQGDFSDDTFALLTNELQNDYVYIDENTNKVISVTEYQNLSKEEQDRFEKTNISDIEDPFFEVAINLFGPNKEERLDVALKKFVPDEKNRKNFVKQYKKYEEERKEQRKSAGGDQGSYVRKFLETKTSKGDKSLPKEKIEEMYRITERYKDLPLNDDDGKANKEKLLSELKDAELSGTEMYRRIKELETSEGESVNSFKEKKYSYTKSVKPEKKSQKLSDATSKQSNANNGLGGYGYANTSLGGIVKGKKHDGDFSKSLKSLDNVINFVGLNDLNQ